MGIVLDLTDLCDDLKTPHRHDPHYSGGEEIHQRQFISEDELLSWDETRGSHSTQHVCEHTQHIALPALITSCPRLLSLQTTKLTVCERWK